MRAETEERPILLLDDILSELDPTRRGYVLEQARPGRPDAHHHHRPERLPADISRGRARVWRRVRQRMPCASTGATAESAANLYRPRQAAPASSGRSASPVSRSTAASLAERAGWSYGPTGRHRARNGQVVRYNRAGSVAPARRPSAREGRLIMNFLGMGPMELMVILVLALIVVGPGKLPEMAGQVGRVVREFRRTTVGAVERVQPDAEPRNRGAQGGPEARRSGLRRAAPAPARDSATLASEPATSRPQPTDSSAPVAIGRRPKHRPAPSPTAPCRRSGDYRPPISRLRTESTATDRQPGARSDAVAADRLFTALRGGCTIPLASP